MRTASVRFRGANVLNSTERKKRGRRSFLFDPVEITIDVLKKPALVRRLWHERSLQERSEREEVTNAGESEPEKEETYGAELRAKVERAPNEGFRLGLGVIK